MNGQVNKAVADQNGLVKFTSIIPGNYTVVSTLKIKAADYTTASGVLTTDDVVFNANLNASINNASGTLGLELKLDDWEIG